MNSMLEQRIIAGKKVGMTYSDDQDIGLVVRYKGSQASATVEVSAAGDITFKHGASGAEAVDSTIDSGGNDAGVIDVSDSNANTFGEVVDLINASSNWEAFLVGVLRSDSSDASTGSLLTMSATQAKKTLAESGVRLYKDTSKVLNIAVAIKNKRFPNGFTKSEDKINEVNGIVSKNTYGSGTSLIQVYEINPNTLTETKIFERAGGATTVEQSLESTAVNLQSDQGNYLLVRLVGSAACTGYLTAIGKTY
jgi:hypothetical protein